MAAAEGDESRQALQRALGAIRDLRARLDLAERAAHEPIAIIGAGCRFPGGVDSPEAFWELLRDRRDAVGPIPADRWDHAAFFDPDPSSVGTIYTDQGGFVTWPVDRFDAPFFGISPREAESLDPQQRLLLEVAWETFEHAGIAPDQLSGTSTGVFVGLGTYDYANLQVRGGDASMMGTYSGTGVSASVAGGRIAYVLGLRGPVVSLDTACSSALVATSLAVQGLRAGTCRTALAGGVNLMLDPRAMVFLSAFKALSPSGRCHAFDASADGYARGEGCGLVLLKRLSDAQADGDRILAVIRGVATNHDGRSSGLTVPNGAAQRAVIQAALDDAGLAPVDVQLVEAHGTGTELGDPIEVRALDAVYSPGRAADDPLHLGSVKTNIGHLEAAAGAAGLIKLVMALQHDEMPAHLHCEHPSPHIDWASMPIEVLREPHPWPRGDRPRRAGISAFGFSGTNAHLIVEEAPAPLAAPAEAADRIDPTAEVIPISARDDAALHDAARHYANGLAASTDALGDLAWTAQVGRARFPQRLAVAASSAQDAANRLRSWAEGGTAVGVTEGRAAPTPPGLAFVFTGQGAQLPGMGRDLFERQPVFRAAMEACDELLRPHLAVPLLDVLYGATSPERIHDTTYTQPAMFALEHSLATLWTAWGIRPSAVAGHSIGEYAAACLAGVIDLPDALRLIAARGRLMGALPAGGRMLAVFAAEADVRPLVERRRAHVGLAAVNGPKAVVVSGGGGPLDEIVAELTAAGLRVRPLDVSHAFHSPLMAPMLDEFLAEASSIELRPPTIPFFSTVTGKVEGEALAEPGYWRRHVEATVRFSDAVGALRDAGIRHVVEIGPQPTLLGLVGRIAPEAVLHPSLRPGRRDDEQIAATLGALWTAGVEPNWAAVHDTEVHRVDMPTYPFQRERHWLPDAAPVSSSASRRDRLHPLVHRPVVSPAITGHVYESVIGSTDPGFLDDHRLFGAVVVPATAHLEAVVAAVADACGVEPHADAPVRLEHVALHEVLVIPDGQTRQVQVVLGEPVGGRVDFAVHALSGSEWRVHVSGSANLLAPSRGASIDSQIGGHVDLHALRAEAAGPVDIAAYYDRITSTGIEYGPRFRTIREIVQGPGWALGRLTVSGTGRSETDRLFVHPALLDGALQLIEAALPSDLVAAGDAYVPVSIGSYRVHAIAGDGVWARARVADPGPGASTLLRCEVDVFDEEGAPVASIQDLVLRPVSVDAIRAQLRRLSTPGAGSIDDWFYDVSWEPAPLGDAVPSEPGTWIVVAADESAADVLVAQLEARHQTAVRIVHGDGLVPTASGQRWRADTTSMPAMSALLRELEAPTDGWAGIVVALDPDRPDDDAVRLSLGMLMAASQALLDVGVVLAAGARLWVVTRNARAVQEQADPVDIAQAAAWGFADSLAIEEPQLRLACVDLAPRERDVALLVDELLAGSDEDRVAFRNSVRHVSRLTRVRREAMLELPSGPYEVLLTEGGSIDGLVLAAATNRSPGPGEVAIAVRASGLNFRDVLGVMGMYPGGLDRVGSECSGVVTAVGAGVDSLEVGDEVVAIVDGGFVSDVVTSAVGVFRLPANLDPVAA
ncbi:MAG: polyketide synthase, partial [Ilumatobacteraceae bacterium]|nr:polyketide synthase [Ilumatobacteraceae bacterium]